MKASRLSRDNDTSLQSNCRRHRQSRTNGTTNGNTIPPNNANGTTNGNTIPPNNANGTTNGNSADQLPYGVWVILGVLLLLITLFLGGYILYEDGDL